VALGFTKRGLPIWPVAGASDDDSVPPVGGDPANPPPGTGGTGDGDADKDGTDDDGDKDGDDKGKKTDDDSELERVRNRMRAADKRASDLEKQLKAIADKDKTDLQRATDEAAEAKKAHADLLESLRSTRLQNAFLNDTSVTWNDPADAFALMDKSDLEIDDEGKISGMANAIKKLAAAKKYLVKETDSSTAASGSSVNGKRKGDDGNTKPDRAALAKDFPALGRR
jgi:hypothetical protein